MKRLAASLLAAAMLAACAGCDNTDKSWAAKSEDLTVPIGVYIYYEYMAYQSAMLQVEDVTQPVLGQTVEGQDASQWIRDLAMDNLKMMFAVEEKMEEMGLELTEEELAQASSSANSTWAQYESALTGFGISKESYLRATAEMSAKSNKLFLSIYDSDGSNPVSEEELSSYFEENYEDFSYLMAPLLDPETGEALAEDAAAEFEAELAGFAEQIAAGEMTIEEAGAAVSARMGTDETGMSFYEDVIAPLESFSLYYPAEFVDMLEEMEPGEAKTITVDYQGSNMCMLAVKRDVRDAAEEYLSSADNRFAVLTGVKGEEFSDSMEQAAEAVTGVTFNDKALDSYTPSMFE